MFALAAIDNEKLIECCCAGAVCCLLARCLCFRTLTHTARLSTRAHSFTGLSYDNVIKPLDPWNDLEDNYGKGAMRRFTNLKRQNPDLKTLVAIGGWNEGSIKYSKMAADASARARFVDSVVAFLAKYNFDGLDMDWEYPGSRGGSSYDKQNFVALLRDLHQAFAPHGYLLTAAVSAGKTFADAAYDIAQVSKYLDLINLMAYDYHGGWESQTGHNAPLFHSPKHDKTNELATLNVNWSVNYWLQNGAPREKIMLGVGSYGRSFTLDRQSETGIGAAASQKGRAGPYTREPGSLGYNEICEAFKRQPSKWTIVREPDYLAPYAYDNERQWVGYDDVESLRLKAQFAKSMGLGGMMMWSIETDDFLGTCHNGEKFPLLNTIKRVLNNMDPMRPAAGNRTTTTTTTARPTTTAIAGSGSGNSGSGSNNNNNNNSGANSSTTSTTTTSTTTSTTRRPSARPASTKRPRPPAPVTPSTSTTSSTSSTTPPPPPPPHEIEETNEVSSTTQAPQPPPPQQSAEFECSRDGMFADPRNCRKFIRCVSLGATFATYKFDCGPGTAFNEQQQYCDHIYNVPGCAAAAAAQPAAVAGPVSMQPLRAIRPHYSERQQQQQQVLLLAGHQQHHQQHLAPFVAPAAWPYAAAPWSTHYQHALLFAPHVRATYAWPHKR